LEKFLYGLFPLGKHPKMPGVFGVAGRRILQQQTIFTARESDR
jgi:hypothetical protein